MTVPSELAAGGYLSKARAIVQDQINRDPDREKDIRFNEIFVISCSKTLQNWKVLIGTTFENDLIYEVNYNGDKSESYLDVYAKLHNIVVPD